MSSYRESAIKRKDFRSVKAAPETPKSKPSKKTRKPYLVMWRFKPEEYKKRLSRPDSWYLGDFLKTNNAWQVWGRHHAAHSAEESCSALSKSRWHDEYEFKVEEK